MSTITPKRIQRQRTKGWKMPEGAVYVGRPTKWGNPFAFKDAPDLSPETDAIVREWAVGIHRDWLQFPEQAGLVAAIRTELRGKDLACWCPKDQPCHADVLLEIANSEGET